MSAELKPPESISVIAYAFSEFVRIKNAIIELAKILIDKGARADMNSVKYIHKNNII